jgi:hypothetical protein
MLCNKHFNKMEVETITPECRTKICKTKTSTDKIARRNSKKVNEYKHNTEYTVDNEDALDNENLIISHHNPATTMCKFVLLSGPRKGCVCEKPLWVPKVNNIHFNSLSTKSAFCKAHYDKGTTNK